MRGRTQKTVKEDRDTARLSIYQPLNRFAAYYNYHRLSGAIGWLTPAERFDGTPFTDRGFENIPALEHLQDWLAELMRAA